TTTTPHQPTHTTQHPRTPHPKAQSHHPYPPPPTPRSTTTPNLHKPWHPPKTDTQTRQAALQAKPQASLDKRPWPAPQPARRRSSHKKSAPQEALRLGPV